MQEETGRSSLTEHMLPKAPDNTMINICGDGDGSPDLMNFLMEGPNILPEHLPEQNFEALDDNITPEEQMIAKTLKIFGELHNDLFNIFQ